MSGCRDLKADTAIVVPVGPFKDKTDKVTPETGIVIGDITSGARIMKEDGTNAAFTPSSWAHYAGGMYSCGLSTDHTDTKGKLRLYFADFGVYVPFPEDFMISKANEWDSCYGAETKNANIVSHFGVATTADEWKQQKQALGVGLTSGWVAPEGSGILGIVAGKLGYDSVRDDFDYDDSTGKVVETFKVYRYDTHAHALAHALVAGQTPPAGAQTGCVAIISMVATHSSVNLTSLSGARTT